MLLPPKQEKKRNKEKRHFAQTFHHTGAAEGHNGTRLLFYGWAKSLKELLSVVHVAVASRRNHSQTKG